MNYLGYDIIYFKIGNYYLIIKEDEYDYYQIPVTSIKEAKEYIDTL
jgi:hypothetical protein